MKNVIPLKPQPEAPPKALPSTPYVPAASHADASQFRERMAHYAKLYGVNQKPKD
jgi:hypothetical protein